MSKRVLVTGGNGFIGANLVLRLLRDGHQISVFTRPGSTSHRLAQVEKNIELIEVELTDKDSIEALLSRLKPHWIFHLAAHGAYSWQKDVARMITTNIIGTCNLLECCKALDLEAFINAGTSSEYGFKDHPHNETDIPEPHSYYAITKNSATQFCRHMGQVHALPTITLRLYSVYGPYEDPKRLIPQLILQGLKGKLPPLVNPRVAHDFIYVDDICEAFLIAAQKARELPGEIFNAGTGRQISLERVVAIAREIMTIDALPEWESMPQRTCDTFFWSADTQKIKSLLGWSPKINFEEGFCKSLDWFRTNG